MREVYSLPGHAALQFRSEPDGSVQCTLCNHRCHIREAATGRCGVRRNLAGHLVAETYAQVSAEAVDPIEKKPLNHFLPGTLSYSLGSVGCNFSCSHCQNWHISQPGESPVSLRTILPVEGVTRAREHHCSSISWTYNEPTLWYEYTKDMGACAREKGLGTIYVTNGYMTEDALSELAPVLNAWRVDIKAFSEDFYRSVCKAKLEPVLNSTIRAHELGLHIEIVTLVIPGLNDSMVEMKELIHWVINFLGPDTPMHFTRFHPDFRMADRTATPVKTLENICEMAKELGLRYPYIGNVGGHPYEHTYCPDCGGIVINRSGYRISIENLQEDRCGHCGNRIAVIRSP